ncbi:hypothetical protein [Tenggerimyces flavus]|uniref:Uncharacterized protein n=1 Tax=Tenggerimyces flavus TaxID=1708749 RepID=A0ABV7YE39_9ACTN|nr:hypothetical protein [Tenggerimyces flavus]
MRAELQAYVAATRCPATRTGAQPTPARCPAWQARIASPIARWDLPVPGGAEEDDVLLGSDDVQRAQVRDQVPRR